MPSSKEIELVLQARLEQGNAIDNAKALGAGISDALEHAFDGLGERIAAKMMMELKTSLGGMKLADMFDSSGVNGIGSSGSPQMPNQSQYSLIDGVWQSRQPSGGAVTDINGAPISSGIAAQQAGQGPTLPGGAQQAFNNVNNPSNNNGGDIPYRRPKFGNDYSTPFMGIQGDLKDDFDRARHTAKRDQSVEMDQIVTKFKAFDTLRKADPSVQMDPEFRDQVSRAKKFAISDINDKGNEISTLAKEISELRKSISDNSEAVKTATLKKEEARTPEEKAAIIAQETSKAEEIKKSQKAEELQHQATDSLNIVKKIGAYDSEEEKQSTETRRKKQSAMVKGLGVAGAAIGLAGDFISNLDQTRLDSAAGTAQLRNQNLRDYMSGDIQSMMATDQLGGDQAVQDRAKGNSQISAWTKMIGGGIGAAAMGIAAIPAAGATLGVGGVALGAGAVASGNLAYDGFKQIMNIDGDAAARAHAMKQSVMEKDKEYMTMSQMGFDYSKSAYSTAQGMGAPGMSGVLYGAGGAMGVGEDSMRMRAVRGGGVSNAQFDQYMQSTMSSMGGQFDKLEEWHPGMMHDQRTPMKDSQIQEDMQRALTMKANGYTNQDMVQSVLFNQGQGGGVADRDRAMQESFSLYNNVTGSGVDKLKTADYLNMGMSRMASSGMGSEGYENNLMNRGLGVAQGMYGSSALEGKNLMNVQGDVNNLYDKARGGNTLAVVAGVRNVNSINKELGTKLNSADEIYLRTKKYDSENEADVKAAQGFFNLNGGKMTTDQTKEVMKKYRENIAKETDKSLNFLDPKTKYLAQNVDQQTAQEADINDKVIKTLANRKDIRPEVAPGTTDKTPPVGKDAQQASELAKAAMLTGGFDALATVVPKVTAQMDLLIKKLETFTKPGEMPLNTGDSKISGMFAPGGALTGGLGKMQFPPAGPK